LRWNEQMRVVHAFAEQWVDKPMGNPINMLTSGRNAKPMSCSSLAAAGALPSERSGGMNTP